VIATRGTPSRTTAAGAISRPAASSASRQLDTLMGESDARHARPRPHRPGAGQRAARRRRRPRLALHRGRHRRALHALRRAGRGELPRVHERVVLLRPRPPLQVDAAGLRGLVADRLGDAFQVSEANPLVGLAGRAMLLRRLGEAMAEQPETFGDDGRPGKLFDALVGPYGPPRRPPPKSRRTRSCRCCSKRSRASGPRPTRSTASRRTAATARAASARAIRRWRWATAGATARCAAPA
jgi:hypothetical protein